MLVYIYTEGGVEVARSLQPVQIPHTLVHREPLWYNISYKDKAGTTRQASITVGEWKKLIAGNADPIAGLLVLLNAIEIELKGVYFNTSFGLGVVVPHGTEEKSITQVARQVWKDLWYHKYQPDAGTASDLLFDARVKQLPQDQIDTLWATLKVHRAYELLYKGKHV